jgi:pimeloyl-ACP methyl ester carboxylesterase
VSHGTAVVLSLAAALAPEAGAQVLQVPRFEPGPCPFEGGEWLDEERIDCGTLFVAESRDRDESRTLRLAVAILRSRAADPSPDPVVFLQGGPGGALVRFAEGVASSALFGAIREQRDLVLWDQRGTGFSDPSFCPDLGMDLTAGTLMAMPPDERVERERRLLAGCRERVLAEGLDFSAYNSLASAHDLEDLRTALEYDRWNLFGGSYGTRLALIAARDHPAGIRSMVLDAVSPTDIGGDDSREDDLLRSLELVFRQCEADQACDALFPDLESEFWEAIEELNAEPFVVPMTDTALFHGGRLEVDGRMLALGLFQGLYEAEFIPLAPHAIRQIRARNATLVRALAADLAPDPEVENPWLQYAVECYEQEPLLAELTTAATARHPGLPDLRAPALPAVCDAWHGERADTTLLRQPIAVDIPTLVASGEFDPITPPRNGRHVAAALPRAHHIEVRAAGHGALWGECPRSIMVAFLDEPDGALDTGCLGELPSVHFVTNLRIAPRFSAAALSVAEGPSTALMVWVGATLLLLASGPLTWPTAALVRRLRRRTAPPKAAGGVVARTLAGLNALCAIGFVVGLALVVRSVVADNPFILGFGLPGEAAPLLSVPWVMMLLGAGTAVCAVLAWRRGWWGRVARVHYSLVAAAAVSFVGVLFAFGLI